MNNSANVFSFLVAALCATTVLFFPSTSRADWDLYDHFDSVFAYEGTFYREHTYTDKRTQGPSGMLLKAVSPDKKENLRPFSKTMVIAGEVKPNQLMISGESMVTPTVVEYVIKGGKEIHIDFGLYDGAVQADNLGGRIVIELVDGEKTVKDEIRLDKAEWSSKTLTLPAADVVLVRLLAYRLSGGSTNWQALHVRGDGELGTREEARALSPNGKRVGEEMEPLKPSPYRVTAKPGYDVLFYKDKPFLSFATKGNTGGSAEMQGRLGFNTVYNEGNSFGRYWPENKDGLEIPLDAPIYTDLLLGQEMDMPYKATISMAHCSPFLPPWLVKRENLGLEGHQLRRGGATHTSFIKPATLKWHKKGLEGWVKPFLDQPSLFVFGQEDDASSWDDYSEDAVASWRTWVKNRFDGDFKAFSDYLGGAEGMSSFDSVPQPERFKSDERFGFPQRLSYLKLRWITESYGDYLANIFQCMRGIAPGIPLTQRYVNWPGGAEVSKTVGFDYNYTFGHLTTEGIPNAYGIGKKSWTGIYAHMGTLPLPRGGSIGKTYSLDLRRGPMNQREWELNLFTLIANGASGFEYSTLVPSWGPRWEPSALYDKDRKLTPTGEAGEPIIKKVLENSRYMMHYEQHPDVAVFHDASFNTTALAGRWGQSKVGIYTLIRESGFHFDPLNEPDMTAEKLRGRKVLVLAGTTSIAPEVQAAIRDYVREGGTLVSVFCSDGQGFPGCNSYDYSVNLRDSVAVKSFEEPASAAHLGDVLGIKKGGGKLVARTTIQSDPYGAISLKEFDALVKEGRWVAQDVAPESVTLSPEVKVIATFEDGSAAAFEHSFGKGRAITFAFDLGLIANNLTHLDLYQWWSDALTELGCRKTVDTGNWFVEGGVWHDDSGNRLVILVNRDEESKQTAKLPDGTSVELEPWEAKTFVVK